MSLVLGWKHDLNPNSYCTFYNQNVFKKFHEKRKSVISCRDAYPSPGEECQLKRVLQINNFFFLFVLGFGKQSKGSRNGRFKKKKRGDLKQNEVHEVEKQFRPAKPEEIITRPNQKCSSHYLGPVVAVQTHPCYDALQLCPDHQ